MITRELILNQMPTYQFDQEYNLDKIVFFDIETTGLSAETSYLYLIGCAYYKEASFHLIQWFSEDIREEALLISTFFDFLMNYEVLIHYNGNSFDIPYINQKINKLMLDYSFDSIKSVDIYRIIKPVRRFLNLDNMRLKTIEAFLQIRRKDVFDGEELIGIYSSYLGKKHYERLIRRHYPEYTITEPSESTLLLQQLLLHNEDDIRGLLMISSILDYLAFFNKPIRILKAKTELDRLIIDFESSVRLPVSVRFCDDLATICAVGKTATLTIQVYEGELKHFYENYKDYYYLPAEDCAVHKSVAGFVDKAYRIKAKPSNCYTRKQGVFAPQYDKLLSPYFMINHKDKLSFAEVHTDFLLQEDNLELYVRHMLNHMITK